MRGAHILAGFGLGFTFLSTSSATTDWEQIHDTLSLYSILIDQKDFGGLSRVFAQDAYASYGGAWANLHGLDAIIRVCVDSVAGHASQHLASVMGIDVHEEPGTWRRGSWNPFSRGSSGVPLNSTANSTTYDQSTLFAEPYYNGSVIYYFGYYLDELVKLEEGWRISNRTWVKSGPGYSGNFSVGTAS